MESKEFNFKSLVDLVLAHWKTLGIVIVLGAVVGAVISLPIFMKPKYQSVAVVYPVNTVLYSDESETEQLLQVFESSSVRDSIIEKFDLYEHYGIERGAPMSRYYLLSEFNERFSFKKTLYESVRLEVLDEDPEMARDMADEMLHQVNSKFNQLANVRGANLSNSYKKQMDHQAAVLDSIENMISLLSKENGLLEYEAQSRELMRGMIDASKGTNNELKDQMKAWMSKAQEAGSTVRMLQRVSEFTAEERSIVERGYLFWREFAFRDVNYIDIIVAPEVSDKKAWPVRWLIVVLSVGAALLMGIVLIAIGKSNVRG